MIVISKTPDKIFKEHPTPSNLENSTRAHIQDVTNGLNFIADQIKNRGPQHDHTKLDHMIDFFNALSNKDTMDSSEWWKKHITEERHHLKAYVPEDVTLIDVIEHLVDCTVASFARGNGNPYDVDLDPNVLQLAVANTVKLLQQNIEVDGFGDLLNAPMEEPTD